MGPGFGAHLGEAMRLVFWAAAIGAVAVLAWLAYGLWRLVAWLL